MHIVDRLVLPFFALRRVLLVGRRAAVTTRAAAQRLRGRFLGLVLALVWLATQVVVLVQLWFDGGRVKLLEISGGRDNQPHARPVTGQGE